MGSQPALSFQLSTACFFNFKQCPLFRVLKTFWILVSTK
jgi:hypothetical protein